MKGRRIDLKFDQIHTMQPGDYGKDDTGLWYCCTPNGAGPGCLGNGTSHHQVTEHKDGTITVSPSILISGQIKWHGFLKNGEWSEC
jgi:hypothetical protein